MVSQVPAEGQRLLRLSRTVAGSAQYLEAVLERIRQASVRFDGSGEALVTTTWKQYADGTPLLGLWIALDADGLIVGHALGDVQLWSGRTVAWITQVVMDERADSSLRDQFLTACTLWVQQVNEWAKSHQQTWTVSEIVMMSPRMTDSWARHAGFDEYRRVYRRIVR